MAKKKNVLLERKKQNEVNKKAIIWIASIFAAIVIAMTVLLIFNR
ncbi:hypothetical protein [Ferviditalea candida]|uniref:Uncharacterized protein n=1 Tax=Ferviditalea candida TaxID=3108399 RepID=A0ABU5ZDC0_9BACL|nr:hypothetical protein [Paenibacillaceae bacterium T2]